MIPLIFRSSKAHWSEDDLANYKSKFIPGIGEDISFHVNDVHFSGKVINIINSYDSKTYEEKIIIVELDET